MKLTRKKIEPMSYYLVDEQGRRVARADKTGEDGRDNYPWSWALQTGVEWATEPKSGQSLRVTGVEESLKAIVSSLQWQADHYGITFPEGYTNKEN